MVSSKNEMRMKTKYIGANQRRFRRTAFALLTLLAPLALLALLARFAPLAPVTRSGNFRPPVSRFHSSNVSGEIFPCTRSSANFRLCA